MTALFSFTTCKKVYRSLRCWLSQILMVSKKKMEDEFSRTFFFPRTKVRISQLFIIRSMLLNENIFFEKQSCTNYRVVMFKMWNSIVNFALIQTSFAQTVLFSLTCISAYNLLIWEEYLAVTHIIEKQTVSWCL